MVAGLIPSKTKLEITDSLHAGTVGAPATFERYLKDLSPQTGRRNGICWLRFCIDINFFFK
jgi:hypothetical protein